MRNSLLPFLAQSHNQTLAELSSAFTARHSFYMMVSIGLNQEQHAKMDNFQSGLFKFSVNNRLYKPVLLETCRLNYSTCGTAKWGVRSGELLFHLDSLSLHFKKFSYG